MEEKLKEDYVCRNHFRVKAMKLLILNFKIQTHPNVRVIMRFTSSPFLLISAMKASKYRLWLGLIRHSCLK